jgi:two-component system sensor histidine kinase UhpB
MMRSKALNQLEAVISAALDAIILLDRLQNIVLFNPAAERMFGIAGNSVLGQPFERFIPDRCRGGQSDYLAELKACDDAPTGPSKWFEMAGLRPGGDEFSMEVSILRMRVEGPAAYGIVLRDITERKRAEAQLLESRRKEQERRKELETFMEAVPAIVWIAHDPECHRITGNQAGQALLRVPSGKNLSKTAPPAERPDHFQVFRNGKPVSDHDLAMQVAGRTGKPVLGQELELRFSDETPLWIYGNAVPLLNEDGTVRGVVATYVDITQRKQAEQALRDSEERFRLAVDCAGLGAFDFDPQTGKTVWSDIAKRNFGLPPEAEVNYETFLKGLHPEDRARVHNLRQAALHPDTGGQYATEYRTIGLEDGKERWLSVWGRALFDHGRAVRFIGMTLDITQRKRAEKALQDSEARERVRRAEVEALAARLQAVREEERTRVAREIHDVLAQELTRLKLDIAWFSRRLAAPLDEGSQKALQHKLAGMMDLTDTAIQSVQKIATELRPVVLDSLGLCAAVEWQARDFQSRTGIRCQANLPSSDLAVDRERSTALFRILQESLTNVARHSEAESVTIQLESEPPDLILRIQDNGRGIRASELDDPRSVGLLGMRERTTLLGGHCAITGRPGIGTTVEARIPVPTEIAQEKKSP